MNQIEAGVLLRDRLRSAFESSLPIPAGTERHLAATLAETLTRTGNFIRAQLAYSLGRAYGADDPAAIQLAIAFEYFHTASLLFDDLPSMDDAEFRRSAVCIHRIYGEGSTILAALALINRAYALLWSTVSNAAPDRQVATLRYIERYLGLGGLLNGQSHDLQYADLPEQERSPQKVAMGKTVGLIRLSLVVPPMIFGASSRTVRMLHHLGAFWGLAYQAIDDLKDVLHEPERTGKSTARDSLLDRPNLVNALGPEAAVQRLEKLVDCGARLVDRLQAQDPAMRCLDAARQRLGVEAAAICGEMAGAQL